MTKNISASQLKSRRKHLKNLVVGGSAVVAGQSIPDKWVKPVMSTAIVPVHAVTSSAPCQIFLNEICYENENTLIEIGGTVPSGGLEAEVNYSSSDKTISSATPTNVTFAADGEVEIQADVDIIEPQDGGNLNIEFVFESSSNLPNCEFQTTLSQTGGC